MYTELEVINHLLSQVGASPVDDPSINRPDILNAKKRLYEAMVWVQKRGWWYNTLLNWPLTPDEDGYIIIDPEFIVIKVLNAWPEACITQASADGNTTYLYSIPRATIVFYQPVELSLVLFRQWPEMPPSVQDWALLRASKNMILHELEDTNKASVLNEDLVDAQLSVMKADLEIKQRHKADNPAFMRFMSGIRPYRFGRRPNPTIPGGGK